MKPKRKRRKQQPFDTFVRTAIADGLVTMEDAEVFQARLAAAPGLAGQRRAVDLFVATILKRMEAALAHGRERIIERLRQSEV